jgi:Flp pilus assembly protein TadG
MMTRPQANANGPSPTVRTRGLFRAKGEEGGALVELSVTLPIILLIMTGIFAFSIALYQKLSLAEGVSAGARTLAADRGDTDPCATAASAIYNAAPTLTKGSIGLTFTLNGVQTTGATCKGSGGVANANMVSGASATVSATYGCTIKVYNFSFPKCSLGSSVTEEIQ